MLSFFKYPNTFDRVIHIFKYVDYPWYTLIVNSKLYWNLYYKHSKRHKDEMVKIKESVLRHRKEVIGK